MELKIRTLLSILFVLLVLPAIYSCKETYTPKPKGFLRIDYPEKKYRLYQAPQGFSFEYPEYAIVTGDSSQRRPEWLNIEFPQFSGKIYLSHIRINGDPGKHANDSRDLVYKHTIKAESIEESLINFPEKRIFGVFYDIKGNAASSIQFFVTDSLSHFLRGSLYFNTQPNQDSLGPVIGFIRKDIDHFIKSLEWNTVNK